MRAQRTAHTTSISARASAAVFWLVLLRTDSVRDIHSPFPCAPAGEAAAFEQNGQPRVPTCTAGVTQPSALRALRAFGFGPSPCASELSPQQLASAAPGAGPRTREQHAALARHRSARRTDRGDVPSQAVSR
ncbi:hypothetical protein OBBRIDRAFT_837282 [Obba rivulosa]|uniref:Secreted protein n=1 Tax=Obba rivulosa TaxID=1052685 RepID=A0A8E2DHX2_9APHY|nr:hypothetical protein OBBRIDRAFT_837282 [Obba rivulosa]